MKKFSYGLNVLLLSAFMYMFLANQSCVVFNNENSPDGSQVHTTSSEKNTASAQSICFPCDPTFDGVVAEDFISVVARYRKTHWDLVNNDANIDKENRSKLTPNNEDGTEFQDSRCAWFSLDRLKQFICNIENDSKCVGLQHDQLGIRFYYAIYPDPAAGDFTGSEYVDKLGQHTLYLVPTVQYRGGDVDFDPKRSCEKNQGLEGIVYLGPLLLNKNTKPKTKLDILSEPDNHNSQFSMNNGKLCPTNCPSYPYNTLDIVDRSYSLGLDYNENP